MASLDAGGIVTSGGVRFLGQRRSYWRLLIRGAALLMITLGIYRFWLVTDVRRFLWSNTEIAGEALEYTGTALELLLGFLVAVALLIPIYVGFFLAALDLGLLGKLSGGLVLCVPRNAMVDRHRVEPWAGLPFPGRKPRALQDEKYVLRRFGRPF